MIITGDCREVLKTVPANSVDCIITSPPYFQMRDYASPGQIGGEDSYQEYLLALLDVFGLCKDILKDDGTMWINIADKYQDSQLLGIPWSLALSLQKDGWILRQDIIWYKPNVMPAGGTAHNRCTPAHEHIFFFTKRPSGYNFNVDAIKEKANSEKGEGVAFGGKKYDESTSRKYSSNAYHPSGYRCKRDVWSIPTQAYNGPHIAPFPEELPRTCILAGCPEGGTVLDMFCGSGTVGKVAYDLGRKFIGIELNPEYSKLAESRAGKHIQTKLEVEA